ncbi:hypothetical protein ACFYVL_24815 [Streptomyces sp. NPDC004111]|uniref:hypothetical protein n=1 Tax=Streptomyces sp. NPDC004111 TaxID=3364690 RepID=UPI0036791EB1
MNRHETMRPGAPADSCPPYPPAAPGPHLPPASHAPDAPVIWRSALAWGLVPLLSAGLLTFVPFAWWAGTTRRWSHALQAFGWACASVALIVLLPEEESPFDWALVLFWVLGLCAVVVAGVRLPSAADRAHREALRAARRRAARRTEARELLARSPELARDLHIGRPDLPRGYDDGGLIDLNTVPARVLVDLLGWTPAQADRAVDVRTRLGRFADAREVIAYTDVPPAAVDAAGPLLVFSA